MCQFDKAFGKKDGITGSEKLMELAGHWFGGGAQKANAAAKATNSDANGDRAYAAIRKHLYCIYGQDNDTAADAFTRLKEGAVVAKDSIVAHQNFYLNLIEAKNAAEAVNGMELLNRRSSIIEVLHARIPHQTEKFIEGCNKAVSFDKLLDFIEFRTTMLKSLQLPKNESKEEVQMAEMDTAETKDRCLYCQGAQPFSQCSYIFAMSLKERVEAAIKLNACFHCSSTHHGAKNCPEKRNVTCVLCNRKGHVAIFHGRPALSSKDPSCAPLRGNEQNFGEEYSNIAPKSKK